jgi:hypothetical protein
MKTITWHKVGTNGNGNGLYESVNRKFRCMFNECTNLWQLLQLDDEGEYQWCQSYGLLRDAKKGAQWIATQERQANQLNAFDAYVNS